MKFFTNILCWNCRGAASKGFPGLVRDLVSRYKADICFLCEPRVSGRKAKSIVRRCGWKCVEVVEAVGFSGGLWLCWNDAVVDVEIIEKCNQAMHVRVTILDGMKSFLATFVYASPRLEIRDQLWEFLVNVAMGVNEPWVMGGDFNAYLAPEDKKGGVGPNWRSMRKMQNCMNSCGMVDLGFSGPMFTWAWRDIEEILDRYLGNLEWQRTFQNCFVKHLYALKSDHRPILLCLDDQRVGKQNEKQFRFLAAWLLEDSFNDV